MTIFRSSVCLILLILQMAPLYAGKLYYRYQNDKGVMVLDDQIPPEFVEKGYEMVNEKGQLIRKVSKKQTTEEKLKEAVLEERKARQEKLHQEQKAHDSVLLKTFSNAEDILRVRDNKLQAIDSNIKIIEGTITRLQDQYHEKLSEAAGLDRSNHVVPSVLKKEMDDLQLQIDMNQTFIETKQQEKQAIRIKSEVDYKRYLQLASDYQPKLEQPEKTIVLKNDLKPYYCRDLNSCNRAWALSQIFVQDHATTDIQLVSNTLIATAQPRLPTDISLAVTRVPEENGSSKLVLEVNCELSEAGEAHCQNEPARSLKQAFYEFLTLRLSSH